MIGSGFIHGVLYGFTGDGLIVTIDTHTGVATTVASYDAGVPPEGGPPFTGVFGAVEAPEPGGVFLVTGALLCFAVRRSA